MKVERDPSSYDLQPNDVVAELLALSIVEHTYTPNLTITIELDGSSGLIADTGRGMRLTPDAAETISHAERALTSIYPIASARPGVDDVLVDLVWGERGSLGPSLANAACSVLEFISRRDGEVWLQRYQQGIPEGPATRVGETDSTGTTIRFETARTIDRAVIRQLIERLSIGIPDLRIAGPDTRQIDCGALRSHDFGSEESAPLASCRGDGLGLEYGRVRLVRAPSKWMTIAADIASRVAPALGVGMSDVEHIGSSAVPGMLSKPVIDLAVGIRQGVDMVPIRQSLEDLGWRYRGDAGDNGGHVFVLEQGLHTRIAHLHIVGRDGKQWRRYIALRDRLRSDPVAREAYEQAKLSLVTEHGPDNSRRVYSSGKTMIIDRLLNEQTGTSM